MDVALLNTYDSAGGAATACRNLHTGLRRIGVNASLLVSEPIRRPEPSVLQFDPASYWPLDRQLLDVAQKSYAQSNRAPGTNTYFSHGLSGFDPLEHTMVTGADVLHLHWIIGLFSLQGISRLLSLGQPVVWTLHDVWAFTGGCHYPSGCRGFETTCHACPQLRQDPANLVPSVLHEKVRGWDLSRLTVVCPSQWLADEARRSRLLRDNRIEVIRYGYDLDILRLHPRNEARRLLGIPEKAVVLLFVCDDTGERRKGFHCFREALQLAAQDEEVRRLISAGGVMALQVGLASGAFPSPVPIVPVGKVTDQEKMALLYNAADAFVLPSLEDNLPNTMLESLSCGTPVIGFASGGIPEMVINGETGTLVPTGDVPALAAAMIDVCRNPGRFGKMRKACRQKAESELSLRRQAEQYRDLYQDVRNRTPYPPAASALEDPAAFATFAYSRKSHFPLLRRGSLHRSKLNPRVCDLKVYQDALAHQFLMRNVPKHGRILEVGGGESRVLDDVSGRFECWNLDKFEGLGNGPSHKPQNKSYRVVYDYLGNFNAELPEKSFDLVFSISALEHVPQDPVIFENIFRDIDRLLKPGGWSFHLFDCAMELEEGQVWSNALLHYFFAHAPVAFPFVPFSRALADPDLYVFGEEAYQEYWMPVVQKPYQEGGRAFSYQVLWAQP